MRFIELKNITVGYEKKKPILQDFNLEIGQGELISLLGPSGCGKTTTLRTIAGFLMTEKGSVIVGGKDYTKIPPNKRNIGLVFQNYALFPHLSVFDNIAYGLRRRKIERPEIARRVSKILDLVSLNGLEQRLPAQLSGGQRQRVALARAIVIEPELLLLDEPLSNLDAKLRDEMRAELSRLQNQLGITMVYVTHDQIEAMSLSSRIIVMNNGIIEQSGTPEEIYERPATAFVARFIGFDNCITGTLTKLADGKAYVDVQGNQFISDRPSSSLSSSDVGRPVNVLFRPDDTIIGIPSGQNTAEVEIDFMNYQGNTIQYGFHLGPHKLRAIVSGKAIAETERKTVLTIAPNKVIVETGGC